MKGNRAAVAAVVVVILVIVGWWMFRRANPAAHVDLIAQFESATKKPAGSVSSIVDADLNGERKKAIATIPPTRFIWKVRVPEDGWLSVSVGVQPEAWTQEGDGIYFKAGVSDGRAYEDLFTQHLNPFVNKGDRRWIPVMVDLSAYSGEEVEVIFNTLSGPTGLSTDYRADMALWGAPEIVTR